MFGIKNIEDQILVIFVVFHIFLGLGIGMKVSGDFGAHFGEVDEVGFFSIFGSSLILFTDLFFCSNGEFVDG
jgi:hypothetical protein